MNNKEYRIFVFDKYNEDHTFSNVKTLNKNINNMENYDVIFNEEAIEEFNKFGGIHIIPENLDFNFYTIILYCIKNSEERYTYVKIDYIKMREVIEKKDKIPNEEFFQKMIYYDISYNDIILNSYSKNSVKNINDKISSIVDDIQLRTGEIFDKAIENPEFVKCKLYEYQKRSINWMIDKERNKIALANSKFHIVNDIAYNIILKKMYLTQNNEHQLIFSGGILADKVGLGKTIQLITLSLLNPAEDISLIRSGSKRFHSRATLIICPGQLHEQWKAEIMNKIKTKSDINIIKLLTKTHANKISYLDLLDADFIIVSFSYFENPHYLKQWMPRVSSNKSFHKKLFSESQNEEVAKVFDEMGTELTSSLKNLEKTDCVLQLINFHRVVVDELHEILTLDKYVTIKNQLPHIRSVNRWGLTATPFKSPQCLLNLTNYVTQTNSSVDIFNNQEITDHIQFNMIRRNTQESVMSEFKLPPIKEVIFMCDFTETERLMYTASKLNNNNSKDCVLLRKICCHPALAEEFKDSLKNCMTLDEIQAKMVNCYKEKMNASKKTMDDCRIRIEKWDKKIKIYSIKRVGRLLKEMKYNVTFDSRLLEEEEKYNLSDDEIEYDEVIINGNTIGFTPITVTDDNFTDMLKIIGKRWNEKRHTLDMIFNKKNNVIDAHKILTDKYNNDRVSYDFYTTQLERININREKQLKKLNNENEDSDEENDSCIICLGEIFEEEIGMTKCGHLFHYNCIKEEAIKRCVCPICKAKMELKDIILVSYEKRINKNINKELKDKNSLIDKEGTKLGNVITFLKNNDEHTIIFSQWEDLLLKIGQKLNEYGIKNIFCRGNSYCRNSAITKFMNEDTIRVLMLSSSSSASGANITKAKNVIILEPITGTFEFRQNMEKQAIGRTHRMGQMNEVTVYRFIIKKTIEEEIYLENKHVDSKINLIDNIPKFETTESEIKISEDKIKELKTNIESKKTKGMPITKGTRHVKTIIREEPDEESDYDSEEFSD